MSMIPLYSRCIKDKVLPKSKLSEATGYALNHKEEIMNYLKDGTVPFPITSPKTASAPLQWDAKTGCLVEAREELQQVRQVTASSKVLKPIAGRTVRSTSRILRRLPSLESRSSRGLQIEQKLSLHEFLLFLYPRIYLTLTLYPIY